MTSAGRARIDARPAGPADHLRRVFAALSMLLVVGIAPIALLAPAVSAAECTGWNSSSVPPEAIRVLRTHGSAAGRVQRVDFKSYVEVVFPAELGPQHPREMLRAQAVAIKQYAWYHAMNWRGRSAAGGCYDVVDSTMDQLYSPETRRPAAAHIAAVEDTWNWAMHRSGRLFASGYRAGSSVACGADAGRGVMMQASASRCARDGKSASEILRIYYGSAIRILNAEDVAAPAAAKPKPTAPSGLIGAGDSTGDKKGDVIVTVSAGDGDNLSLESRVYPAGQVPGGGGPVKIALANPPTDALGQAAADVNGDDLEDLVVLARAPEGGLRIDVALAADGSGALTPPTTWWQGGADAIGWDGSAGVRVAAGDVDKDGEADLLVVGGQAPLLGATVVWRFKSSGAAFASPDIWWAGYLDGELTDLLAADVDADGRADLVLQADLATAEPAGKGLRYSVVRTAVLLTDGPASPAVPWLDVADVTAANAAGRVAVSDVNRDRREDLVVARPAGASGTLLLGLLSNGTAFTRKSLWLDEEGFRASALQLAGADVDGDGRGDLVIMYNLGENGTRFFRFVSDGSVLRNAGSTNDPTLTWAGAAIE
jgi:hypothetical protein